MITKQVPGSIVALARHDCRVCLFGRSRWKRSAASSAAFRLGCRPFAIPEFRADLILPLLPSAFTVAMLAAIESLLSAVVADNMSGDRHKPDVELLAQGIANLARAAVRRHPGHRRDRPHGDQHSLRRRRRPCPGSSTR